MPEGFDSWQDFFAPAGALRGHISMLKSSRDVVGMALKSLGHSTNSDDRIAIREAGRLLQAQKPFVRSYDYVQLGEKSSLLAVIAEGVEREEQLQFLRAHGCDRVQGYLVSRPVPADEMSSKLLAADAQVRSGASPDPSTIGVMIAGRSVR